MTDTERAAQIPETIRVAHKTFTVHTDEVSVMRATIDEGAYLYGLCETNEQRIVVAVGKLHIDGCRETLIHEIGHAIQDIVGIEYDFEHNRDALNGEAIVRRTASVWLQVLRDNPALIAYLTATDA